MPDPLQLLQQFPGLLTVDPGTQSELDQLASLPEASGLELLGRAAKGAYLRGVQAPVRTVQKDITDKLGFVTGAARQVQKGFAGKPSGPTKVGGPPPEWFAQRGLEEAASAPLPTPPVSETVVVPSRIRAFRDAQGRTVFSNDPEGQQESGAREINYDLATAAMRPAGRQAGGVSSPVARDDQGRTTMVPDPELGRQREQELQDLWQAAIVQQLKDQANPQAQITRELEAAKLIASQFQPSPEELKAYVDANTKALIQSRPGLDPAAARTLVEQAAKEKLAQAQRQAVEEHFNKLHYPGQTLSGYGAQLRGDALNLGG